jgi:hypothetical protein
MIIPLIIGACLSGLVNITGSITFLLATFVGINLTRIEGNSKINLIRKKILYSSLKNNKEHGGLCVGKWFITYFTEITINEAPSTVAYIISTYDFINDIMEDKRDGDGNNDKYDDNNDNNMNSNCLIEKGIKLYQREGSFWSFRYESRTIYPFKMTERYPQTGILDVIDTTTSETNRNFCSVIVSGKPGNGKSTIGILLAQRLLQKVDKINFVDSWSPTDPGDTFENLYTKISPTKLEPLIVMLEEVDGIVSNIHNNKIERHKNIPIPMRCKKDWNSFFDKFSNGRYPHTYIILTTNQPFSLFDTMDSSYLRENRITIKYSFS